MSNSLSPRILVVCLLSAIITGPVRAEWKLISFGPETEYYLDPATVKGVGSVRRVWELSNERFNSASKPYRSVRSLNEYECKEGKVRTIQMTAFEGQMALSMPAVTITTASDWTFVAPNTIGEVFLRWVCNR